MNDILGYIIRISMLVISVFFLAEFIVHCSIPTKLGLFIVILIVIGVISVHWLYMYCMKRKRM